MSGRKQSFATNANHFARVFLAVVFCMALLPFQAGASPDPDDIVVVGFKGDVRISMGGTPQSVRAGGTLALPAAIRTGHDGSVDLRQGDTTIGVGPDTQLDFPAPSQEGALFDRIVQPTGSAFYNVAPRGSNRLRVETPFLVAVIKGTQFNVAVEQDSSTISLFEGRLQVLTPDTSAAVELNAGEIAIRHSKDDVIRVIQMKDRTTPAAQAKVGSGAPATTVTDTADKSPRLPRAPSPLDDDVDVIIDSSKPGSAVDSADGTVSVDVSGKVSGLPGTQIALDAGTDLGAAGVDAAAGAAIDLGAGTVDAAVDTAVDPGTGTVDAAVDTAVDLGGTGVDAGLGVDAAVDASSAIIDSSVDAGLSGTDASVDIGADLSGVDAGLDLGLDVLGTEVDLGLSGAPAPAETDTSTDSGGLLGGILRPLGR